MVLNYSSLEVLNKCLVGLSTCFGVNSVFFIFYKVSFNRGGIISEQGGNWGCEIAERLVC